MDGLSRRDFMRAGAAGVALAAGGAHAKGSPNERLQVGVIGCGSIANNHVGALLRLAKTDDVELIALCDVYETRAREYRERVRDQGGKARVYTDYRKLLSNRDVDYVVVATPEHTHHRIVMDALDAGKHVYCEKPLCYDVAETQEVVARARETGLQLQVGVQGMADDSYGAAFEAIRGGKLGPVVQAQIEYVRNHKLERGPWRRDLSDRMEKPRDLDWEAWLGVRPQRPWDPHLYYEWRCYREFSGGIATDLFVHRVTRIIRACGLGFPLRAAGLGGVYMWDDSRDTPDNMEMLLEYPPVEGVTPGMTVHLLGTMSNKHRLEHCIRGHEATLVFTRTGWDIIDENSREVVETYTKTTGEDMGAHHRNHHAAIREGVALNCPPELGLYGVVAARMGNLSWEHHAMTHWDNENAAIKIG